MDDHLIEESSIDTTKKTWLQNDSIMLLHIY